MEKEYQISWFKIIGITALIAIVVAIIFLVYPKNDSTSLLTQQTYINNITLMKDAGFEYFKGSNLPKEIGEAKRITLDEMLARNLIVEFLDEEGNSCNTTNSYIEATKTMDNEYEMSIYLSCDNKSDYIITSISNEVVCTDCNISTPENNGSNTTTNTGNNMTANDNSTSSTSSGSLKPTYTTNNNSNSSRGDTITINQDININYINTCCTDGNSSNCNDNCLTNVYHSVIFDANGGSVVQTQIVKHGNTADYRYTYRNGYEFLGWYLNGVKYDFSTPVTEKITLVAKWKKKDTEQPSKDTYIVDFESNGGTFVDSQEVLEGETAYEPKDPTKDCYEFIGWYTDKALTKRFNFSTPITSDMTLYAKWRDDGSCKETYTVKFDSNGGTRVSSQNVEEGARAYEPNEPTRRGYTFLGWYLNDRKFNFNTRIYEDITLEAEWEKDEVKYNTYCKIETETHYSISYTTKNQSNPYSWQVKFDDLNHIDNLKITDYGDLRTYNDYRNAYNYSADKSISMVGGISNFIPSLSVSSLQQHSLKSTDFTISMANPYYRNGYWYTNITINAYNFSNATALYTDKSVSPIYFVPFYFEIEYTDLNNCINDKASNSYKYDDYEIVDTYYR